MLLGELDYANSYDDAEPLQINIAQRIKHPNFSGRFTYNDIALLRLENIVTFNDYIRPACLPESSSIASQAMATGWGETDSDHSVKTHLQKVKLDLVTHGECDAIYRRRNFRAINRGIINELQICAGEKTSRKDTCKVRAIEFIWII